MNYQKEYIGQGLSFPLGVNARGELSLVTGSTDIEQSIRIILGTVPGERVMRPEFGCRAWELVFAPNNESTHALLGYYVEQALNFWEPRIEIESIKVVTGKDAESTASGVVDGENKLVVQIAYRIKATHDVRSIVYPFYLMGEE